jgi:diguanylate cyclase (GGDEF)-like protein/PAS domain S-box-containing protein
MAYIETDADLRVSQWSQGAKDLFRHSGNEALGRFLNELIPVSKDPLIQCTRAGTMSIFHGPGQNIQCDITYAPIMTLEAEKMGVALLAISTSDKLKEETDLNQKNQHLEEMYGVAPIGIYHVNLEGDITMANSEYAWMLGYESSDAVVNQIKNFTTQVFFDQEKAEEFMFNIFEADQIVRFRCRLKRKDNSYLWALCYAKTTRNESGKINGFNGFSIDINPTVRTEQALEKANEQLKILSGIDSLTQIPNRRKFDEYLMSEWSRHIRGKNHLSVILCDIDFFKYYNDTYGHQAGDDCLRQVARAIHDSSRRSSDLVARYGGEEFVFILPNTDLKGATTIAERVRISVKNLKIDHQSSAIDRYVTLSLGIASTIPENDTVAKELVSLADKALYEAKEGGRNQCIGKMLKKIRGSA